MPNPPVFAVVSALSFLQLEEVMPSDSPLSLNATEKQQKRLLRTCGHLFENGSVPPLIAQAFLHTPRHLFVQSYIQPQTGQWVEETNLQSKRHIDSLYLDQPICIYRSSSGKIVSTISQPSLVLYMIDLLDLEPGHRVLEVGGGSGWNAALMARLVAPNGHVYSLELIDALTSHAQEVARDLRIENLSLSTGDGGDGFASHAPFDCGVFTASARNVPLPFFEQIKNEGLLLFVMDLQENGDLLVLLRRKGNHFVSELQFPCSFVPLLGAHQAKGGQTLLIEELEIWDESLAESLSTHGWESLGLLSEDAEAFALFCEVVEKEFHRFDSDRELSLRSRELLNGYWIPETQSLALVTEYGIQSTANDEALSRLKSTATKWLDLKKPRLDDLELRVYPKGQMPSPDSHQWLVEESECYFLWGPLA